jgi:ABC-2 type transport system permease protein
VVLSIYTLWLRDLVRFVRQRSRIVGAFATPIVFWALLGSGLGDSFSAGGAERGGGYLHFFFPGTLALIVLFTAIFSTISLIEDRQQGFLQGVLVAPVSRTAIVLGKLLGGTTLALAQAGLFLLLAPVAGISLSAAQLPALLLMLALLAFALTGLGFVIAWWLDSTQGFHAIMNLLLVPMWVLSGAVFPASGAAAWLRPLMHVNPMTYGVAGLQQILIGHTSGPSLGVSVAVTAVFGLAMLGAGTVLASRRVQG